MAESERDSLQSLPLLQNHIKRDPDAYEGEFATQLQHFSSVLAIQKERPQKPNKNFAALVMFLAHVSPCYPGRFDLASVLTATLDAHLSTLHRTTRRVIVNALVLLRNKHQVPLMTTLPVYFKLFAVDDKLMRTQLFTHIAKDILQVARTSKSHKMHGEIQKYLFTHLKGAEYVQTRKAVALLIALYYKRVWTDPRTVNMISSAALCPDLKVAGSAILFFLGNKPTRTDGELSDEEDDEQLARDAAKEAVACGSKKTKGRLARLERVKRSAKKVLRRKNAKNASSEASVDFAAVDVLYDPQAFAEKLLQRAQKSNEPFAFRLKVLQLATRLIGRHELLVLNVYPFLQRYLSVSQRQVTQVLACTAQAMHDKVPPEEVRPVVQHILRTFVTEHAAPEVSVVGLNALRECAIRCPLCLDEDALADLAGFLKFRGKGVPTAARSLINLYREVDPLRLARALRGREASLAVARGEVEKLVYGRSKAIDGIEGLELLAASKRKPSGEGGEGGERSEEAELSGEEGSLGDDASCGEGSDASLGESEAGDESELGGEGESEAEGDGELPEELSGDESEIDPAVAVQARAARDERVEAAQGLAMDEILSNKDFQKLEKLKFRQRLERQLGRKRKHDEIELDASSSDSGPEEEGDTQWDVVDPTLLKYTGAKNKTKAARLAKVLAGREGREKPENRARRGGSTNKEKRRRKPLAMVKHERARGKSNQTASEKMQSIRKHVKTLKKAIGPQKRRRK